MWRPGQLVPSTRAAAKQACPLPGIDSRRSSGRRQTERSVQHGPVGRCGGPVGGKLRRVMGGAAHVVAEQRMDAWHQLRDIAHVRGGHRTLVEFDAPPRAVIASRYASDRNLSCLYSAYALPTGVVRLRRLAGRRALLMERTLTRMAHPPAPAAGAAQTSPWPRPRPAPAFRVLRRGGLHLGQVPAGWGSASWLVPGG